MFGIIKNFLIYIVVALFLLNNISYAESFDSCDIFKSLGEQAATAEDKVLINSFADLIKEKATEKKSYPQIVANGVPASFILFEDGEIVLTLNMGSLKIGQSATNEEIEQLFRVLIKKVGKKNMHSYQIKDSNSDDVQNIYVRLRIK